mmetsp:Transcript_43932/g.125744  ORF Transcript_43932/g.125744 Transcript_43932/m.125744 type:complete len:243 (-) Transcript_43932:155-883(-)
MKKPRRSVCACARARAHMRKINRPIERSLGRLGRSVPLSDDGAHLVQEPVPRQLINLLHSATKGLHLPLPLYRRVLRIQEFLGRELGLHRREVLGGDGLDLHIGRRLAVKLPDALDVLAEAIASAVFRHGHLELVAIIVHQIQAVRPVPLVDGLAVPLRAKHERPLAEDLLAGAVATDDDALGLLRLRRLDATSESEACRQAAQEQLPSYGRAACGRHGGSREEGGRGAARQGNCTHQAQTA